MNMKMGNDDFILYARKNLLATNYDNAYLGKIIWEKIKELDEKAFIVKEDMNCIWGDSGEHVNSKILPKTATQFSFNRIILLRIYEFLDSLK